VLRPGQRKVLTGGGDAGQHPPTWIAAHLAKQNRPPGVTIRWREPYPGWGGELIDLDQVACNTA
jgi:hypothetical protein